MKTAVSVVALGLSLCSLVGCAREGDGRIAIHGTVTYAGEPIPKGKLTLVPVAKNMPIATAVITDGKYELPAKHGPQAGEHVVQVEGFKLILDSSLPPLPYSDDENSQMVPKPIVPEKHNTKSTRIVEIQADTSQYDFNLEK